MKIGQKFLILNLIIILLLSACVTPSTRIASMTDPAYKGKSFKRILVIASLKNTYYLQRYESLLVRELKKKGIYAIANHEVLPSIREYTEDEKRSIYNYHNLDSYIIITPQGVETATINVPTTAETTGNRVIGTRTTIHEGGTKTIATQLNNKIQLYDIFNGNLIWQADAETDINSFSGDEDIYRSLIINLVKQLKKDGII